MAKVTPFRRKGSIAVNLPDLNSGPTHRDIIHRAVLAALMHVKPDYRSPRKLDECAGIITDFVQGAIKDVKTAEP